MYRLMLDVFFMAGRKGFPLQSLKSTLDNLQSTLHKAENQFKEDKDLSDSIKEAEETVAKVNNQITKK